MVFRLAFLVLFCTAFVAGAAAPQEPRCLACHPAYHAEAGSCVDCHRGDPRSSRPNIAHHGLIQARYAYFTLPDSPQVEQGLRQLETYACRRCHISGQRGNRLATNLDGSVAVSDPQPLVEAIRNPVLFMPDFSLAEPQLDTLINALYGAGQRAIIPTGERPQVVHFEERNSMEDHLFVKHCGSCHRLLSVAMGGLGTGEVAPNLSGLLSEFYPKTAVHNDAWNRDNLKKWLRNPREIRPLSQMMPIPLAEEELARLLDLLDEDISLTAAEEVAAPGNDLPRQD